MLIPDANDRDAFNQFCRNAGLLLDAGYRGDYGLVPLPKGKDPGSMLRATLRSMVRYAAECAAKNKIGDQTTIP